MCRPTRADLSKLRPDLIDFCRFESQPFQETLVADRVTALEQLMPLSPFRFIQADFFKHRDPFFNVYMVFHMSVYVAISLSVQFCHGHDGREAKV